MMHLMLEELAGILHSEVQQLYYEPEAGSVRGNVYLESLEDDPDEAVALEWAEGRQSFPSTLREDVVALRVRGGNIDDRLAGVSLAEDIASAVHGWLRPVGAAGRDGRILLITAEEPPYHIGYDEKKRPEFMMTLRVVIETRDLS